MYGYFFAILFAVGKNGNTLKFSDKMNGNYGMSMF